MKAVKYAFWGLYVAGLYGCTAFGIGPVLQRAGGSWTSPYMLAGCVLGACLLALGVAFAAGFRPAMLPTDAAMVVALCAVIGAKVGVALIQLATSTPAH